MRITEHDRAQIENNNKEFAVRKKQNRLDDSIIEFQLLAIQHEMMADNLR